VIGAYYYLKIVKVMFLDESTVTYPKLKQPVEGGLIFLAALIVSPLGYFLIGPLTSFADRAAGSLF
jgi:NADH-quinone oxidoreductase subunit N